MADRICPVCGAVFKPAGGKLTCSRGCGQRLRYQVRPPSGRRKARSCEICGATYDATYAEQRTCGRRCGAILNDSAGRIRECTRAAAASGERRRKWPCSRIYPFQCPGCEGWFAPPRLRRVCSRRCEYRVRARSQRRQNPVCDSCGDPVGQSRRLCDECQRVSHRERRYRDKKRRAALKRGAAVVESVSLRQVASRDRFLCGLCGRRVKMTAGVPHPLAPTVDHVVPLSVGGDHSMANVQLAHFRCNYTKSDRGTQQLALIG